MNTTNEVATTQEGVWVPIRDITIPEDARPHTQEDIDSRAVSMDREGQAQSALLSKEGDKLMLVYGHGRLLSALKLGWEKLRCDIKEGLTETQKLLLILAENKEREDASPIYTAMLYSKLMSAEGLSQNQLAQKMGIDQGLISKYLAVLSLAPEVWEVMNRFITPLAHALVIAKLPKREEQVQLAQECAAKDYSVRELQARVKKLLDPDKAGAEAPAKPAGDEKPIRFNWKDGKLMVKAVYDPQEKTFVEFSCGIESAYRQFVDLHPMPKGVAQAA